MHCHNHETNHCSRLDRAQKLIELSLSWVKAAKITCSCDGAEAALARQIFSPGQCLTVSVNSARGQLIGIKTERSDVHASPVTRFGTHDTGQGTHHQSPIHANMEHTSLIREINATHDKLATSTYLVPLPTDAINSKQMVDQSSHPPTC